MGWFAAQYATRYPRVWQEFLRLADGEQPPMLTVPRYVYPLVSRESLLPEPSAPPQASADVVSYRFSRLCFKADVIEPLRMEDTFEVITRVGTFRMTKAEFYRDFPNVVGSKSYGERRIYHYPKVPHVALKFRI